MKNYSREQEMREFYIHEKYILSNFDLKSVTMYNATLSELKNVKINLSNFREKASKVKGCDIPEDFMNVYFLAKCYAKSKFSDTKNIEIASKVAALLHTEILDTPICNYIETRKSQFSDIDEVEINVSNTSFIKAMYTFLKSVNIHDYINDSFPYLYTNQEIDEFEKKFSECIRNSEEYEIFQDILYDFFNDLDKRIKLEYGSHRLFYERQRNTNSLRDKHSYNLTDISIHIDSYKESIKEALYVVYHFNEEYDLWKYCNDTIKAVTSFSNSKFECFSVFYYNIDDQKLYDFFKTLNEPHAFGKVQIDYILEMAPKLRIASHLNKEYANYKKLYNPDARDFDFGEDEPEEEQQQHLDECQTEEVVELGDNYVEETKQYHLDRLPHFTEDKFRELLKRFRKNDLNYIHKFTREEDWLFVFGLNGNTPPEGFKKVQWRGKNKKKKSKVSPLKFVNFLEILGYKLKELYDDVELLNRCFIAKDDKDGKIIKKDFNYKNGQFLHVADYQELKKIVSEIGLCP